MEIVSFEIAKKLKEKGFKEKCLAYYDIDDNVGLLYNTQYSDEYSPCQYTDLLQSHNTDTAVAQPDDSENCCDAPSISQVLKWLREKKQIEIVVLGQDYIGGPYFADVFTKDGPMNKAKPYPKYEHAALAGIKYVLDNLI